MKDEKILQIMSTANNLRAIRIEMDLVKFKEKSLSDSAFFRKLKNGLHSFNGVTNRDYFKNLSGVYFSIYMNGKFKMILLYEADKTNLNRLQVIARVKRLLGIECSVELGEYSEYEDGLNEIISVSRKTQPFGDYYYSGNSCPI